MKDTFKRVKADLIFSALMCVLIGIVLLFWPAKTIGIFCKVLAAAIILMGVVNIALYIRNRELHPFSGVLGTIVLLVGIWIFVKPESIVSLIPIVIGVILSVHGIQDLKLALETRANGYEKWWSMLIIAAISFVCGVLCIVNAFGVVTLALQFIGVALIYDGVSDLWIASRTIKVAREMKQEAEALDIEYKEVDEEK